MHPCQSPWQTLYESADASSFLHITGLNRCTFIRLLDYVFDLEEIRHRRACRRPRLLTPEGYLGLLLFYLGKWMNYIQLCVIIGFTPTVCSHLVNWMLKKVVRLLRGHPFVRVKFPNGEKMREYADMVRMREPMVDDIIGFMGGVSFPAECTNDRVEQDEIYCGYNCNTWPQWEGVFCCN